MMHCVLFTQPLWIHMHRRDSVCLFPPLKSFFFFLSIYNNKTFNNLRKNQTYKDLVASTYSLSFRFSEIHLVGSWWIHLSWDEDGDETEIKHVTSQFNKLN